MLHKKSSLNFSFNTQRTEPQIAKHRGFIYRIFDIIKAIVSLTPPLQSIIMAFIDYIKSIDKKTIFYLRSFLILTGFCLVIFFVGVNHFGEIYQDGLESRVEKKQIAKEELITEQEIEAYNFWVKKAENYLKSDMYNNAYKDFLFAQSINKNGKRANLGIAICLQYQCKHEGKNCENFEQYYQKLKESGNLNSIQMSRLKPTVTYLNQDSKK